MPLIATSLLPSNLHVAASTGSMRAVRSIAAPELPVVSVPLPTRRTLCVAGSISITSTVPRNAMLAGPNFTATVPL